MKIFSLIILSLLSTRLKDIKVLLSEPNLLSEEDKHLKSLHFSSAMGRLEVHPSHSVCFWRFCFQSSERACYEPWAFIWFQWGLCGSLCGTLCKYSILSPAFDMRGPHIERESDCHREQRDAEENLKRRRETALTFNLYKYSPQQAITTVF